jgi:hypothetical protein
MFVAAIVLVCFPFSSNVLVLSLIHFHLSLSLSLCSHGADDFRFREADLKNAKKLGEENYQVELEFYHWLQVFQCHHLSQTVPVAEPLPGKRMEYQRRSEEYI